MRNSKKTQIYDILDKHGFDGYKIPSNEKIEFVPTASYKEAQTLLEKIENFSHSNKGKNLKEFDYNILTEMGKFKVVGSGSFGESGEFEGITKTNLVLVFFFLVLTFIFLNYGGH